MTTDQFIARLKERDPLPPLYPDHAWDKALSRDIQAAKLSPVVRAGLLLWNDDLDASHSISQGIETPTGSFWHAIMHRREGDLGNSLYWWRRTGSHAAFAEIGRAVLEVLANETDSKTDSEAASFAAALERAQTWLPEEFVRHCGRAERSGGEAWLQKVQVAEMETLLRWSERQG